MNTPSLLNSLELFDSEKARKDGKMRTFCNRNAFYYRYRHKKVRIFGKFAFFVYLCHVINDFASLVLRH